ncbi:hypothetical protein ABE545_23125 [Sphingobacterium faecium]|uniref:hypothetical protein n=1 Tax=Sphingobacterium faecium TaxID=34087 RepID=UPI00320B3F35
MNRLFIIFSFVLVFSTTAIKAELCPEQNLFSYGVDTLSNTMKNYIIKSAISDGLDKNHIKISTDSWGNITVSDQWSKNIKYKQDYSGNLTKVKDFDKEKFKMDMKAFLYDSV